MSKKKVKKLIPISSLLEEGFGFSPNSYITKSNIKYTKYYFENGLYLGWENLDKDPIKRRVNWFDLLEEYEEFYISSKFNRQRALSSGVISWLHKKFSSIKLEFQYILGTLEAGKLVATSELRVKNFDFEKRYKLIKIYPEYAQMVICEAERFDELKAKNFPMEELIVLSTSLLTFAHDVSLYR